MRSIISVLVLVGVVFGRTEIDNDGAQGWRAGEKVKTTLPFEQGSLRTTTEGGGSYGVDISAQMSSTTASCLVSQDFGSIIIPRGYKSTGSIDTAVCGTLNAAVSAGIKIRDAYIFPDPTGTKSARSQMSELVNYLTSNCKSAWSGRIWLDVEGSQYWKGDFEANKKFYQELYDSCSALGVSCGVYSSSYQWQSLFGSTSYCYGSASPLWYAHYDNIAAFSDYSPFGCWSKPWAKQYKGDTTMCNFSVDLNWSPNF